MHTPEYTRALIVPGYKGSGATHWQSWLARKCKHLGVEAHLPKLPDRFAEPKLPAWLEALERTLPIIDNATALVGHSLGCATILQLVARQSNEAGLVILVAPASRSRMLGFVQHFWDGFDPARVKEKLKRVEIYTSDNDPFVDPDVAYRLAMDLGASFHLIHGGGHLSVDAGYHTFPEVLDLIAPTY